MSELAQALAVEDTIEHEGVVYPIGPISIEVMAGIEDWLERDTIEELSKLFPGNPDAIVRAMTSSIASGVFKFTSIPTQMRISELDGRQKLWYLRIRQNRPAVDEQTIKDAVEAKWVECVRIHQKEMAARAALDPNAAAPVLHEEAGGKTESTTTDSPG